MPKDRRAEYIEALLEQRNKSARWLAREVNVAPQTVLNWLDGTNAPRDDAVWDAMIGKLLPSSHAGQSTDKTYIVVYETPLIRVPVAGPDIHGKPFPIVHNPHSPFEEIPDRGGRYDIWGKTIKGFSMENRAHPQLSLEAGDRVLFENRDPENGHIVHAVKGSEEAIRIYKKSLGGSVKLAAANEDYEDEQGEGWEILGVAMVRVRYLFDGARQVTEYPSGMRVR